MRTLGACFLGLSLALARGGPPAPVFSVWPQPARFDFDNSSVARLEGAEAFEFHSDAAGEDAGILERAFARYRGYIFDGAVPADAPLPVLSSLRLSVVNGGAPLELGADESYELTVEPGAERPSARLRAKTVWGALRGLETFAQLVSEELLIGGNVSVVDAPRFRWRGLLVDTGRHFLSLDVLQAAIEGLAAQKMNVFHWHVTDSQSFPLQVEAFPELAHKGAYRYPAATYSRCDVAHVVSFARDRGVRVVLEVETPGHAASWGHGYPELATSCPNFHTTFTSQLDRIPLDVSRDFTYEVVEAVLRETAEYTPDRFLHLGGDEVQYGCWNESQGMRDWMARNRFQRYEEAEAFYLSRVVDMAKRQGNRRGVVWQEAFDNGLTITNASLLLPRDTVVEFWYNRSTFAKALELGHDVLMSEGWYLDLANPGLARGRRQDSWIDFYNLDPTVGAEGVELDLVERHLLGGEAAMWSEEIDSANLLDSIFPRSSAVAERLHTPLDRIGDAGDPTKSQLKLASVVTQRLESFRCVLWRRGIRAGPVAWPSHCSGPPSGHHQVAVLAAPVNTSNGVQFALCVLASGVAIGTLFGVALGSRLASRSRKARSRSTVQVSGVFLA